MRGSSQGRTSSFSTTAERRAHPVADAPGDRRCIVATIREPAGAPAVPDPLVPDGALLREFVGRLIALEFRREAVRQWVDGVGGNLLGWLTPAARRLGEMWTEDECSFCDVTVGMHRLTLLLIDLDLEDDRPRARPHGGCFLLAPAPGDQHAFGTLIVGLTLRRAGWDVTADVVATAEAIGVAVAARHYDAAGFSVGHERAVGPVSDLVRTTRSRSRNPDIRIAVGGPMIVGNGPLARSMGADLWADDAEGLVLGLPRLPTALI